jgi:hypothetical protein
MTLCVETKPEATHFSMFVDFYFEKTKREFPFLSDEEVMIFLTQDFQEKHTGGKYQ